MSGERLRILHLTDLHLRRSLPGTAQQPKRLSRDMPNILCSLGDISTNGRRTSSRLPAIYLMFQTMLWTANSPRKSQKPMPPQSPMPEKINFGCATGLTRQAGTRHTITSRTPRWRMTSRKAATCVSFCQDTITRVPMPAITAASSIRPRPRSANRLLDFA